VVPKLVTLVEANFAVNAIVKMGGCFQSVCFDKEKKDVFRLTRKSQKDMIDNLRRRHFLLNWAGYLDCHF
jgi:hypothetical protein